MTLIFNLSKKRLKRKHRFLSKTRNINKNYNYKKLNKNSENLMYYGPVGSMHINQLAKYLKRSIKVWSKTCLIRAFGKYSEKPEINVEYIANDSSQIGHFSLKNQIEPSIYNKYPNNCLFDAIAPQVGIEANKLRQIVIRKIRRKFKNQRTRNFALNKIRPFTSG
jgi:hypothetical protein